MHLRKLARKKNLRKVLLGEEDIGDGLKGSLLGIDLPPIPGPPIMRLFLILLGCIPEAEP